MIRHMRFTDLPAKQRAKQGEAAIQELHRALFMPMPEEHRHQINQKISEITTWMQAPQTVPVPIVLPTSDPAPLDPASSTPSTEAESSTPFQHEVVVEESLRVETLIT